MTFAWVQKVADKLWHHCTQSVQCHKPWKVREASLSVQCQARLHLNFEEKFLWYSCNIYLCLWQRNGNTANKVCFLSGLKTIGFARVFLRRFRDPIRVPRLSNRIPRIRENYHRVPKIRENRIPRIREIGSLQIQTEFLTFSSKKTGFAFFWPLFSTIWLFVEIFIGQPCLTPSWGHICKMQHTVW